MHPMYSACILGRKYRYQSLCHFPDLLPLPLPRLFGSAEIMNIASSNPVIMIKTIRKQRRIEELSIIPRSPTVRTSYPVARCPAGICQANSPNVGAGTPRRDNLESNGLVALCTLDLNFVLDESIRKKYLFLVQRL